MRPAMNHIRYSSSRLQDVHLLAAEQDLGAGLHCGGDTVALAACKYQNMAQQA